MQNPHLPQSHKKVTPTKSLFFFSVPCEVRAAVIRNKTIDAINSGDPEKVRLSQLINTEEELIAINKIIFSVIFSPLLIDVFLVSGLKLDNLDWKSEMAMEFLGLMALLYFIGLGVTNIAACQRYDLSRRQAETWLDDDARRVKFV